jgi:hypothetical protein
MHTKLCTELAQEGGAENGSLRSLCDWPALRFPSDQEGALGCCFKWTPWEYKGQTVCWWVPRRNGDPRTIL